MRSYQEEMDMIKASCCGGTGPVEDNNVWVERFWFDLPSIPGETEPLDYQALNQIHRGDN